MSECDVCVYSDGEMAEIFHSKEVKGRKEYKCEECDRVIAKGTLHQFVTMKCEGEWMDFRTCLICAEIRKAFSCDGEMFGCMFWDSMTENFPHMNTTCFTKLKTPEAKAYLMQRWQEWKGLSNV